MVFLLGCLAASPPVALIPDDALSDEEAVLRRLELGGIQVERDVVADPGHFDEGVWISDPLDAATTIEGAPLVDGRVRLTLPWGRTQLAVRRPCGVVVVAVSVGSSDIISVPWPSCSVTQDAPPLKGGVRLDRWERSWGEVWALEALGVITDVPPPPEGEAAAPARYVDQQGALDVCSFWGGRLPTEAEWREAGGGGPPHLDPEGPLAPDDPGAAALYSTTGHGDLDGGVSEWIEGYGAAMNPVVGASWMRAAEIRSVPFNARSDEIGFRCAFNAR